MSEVDAINWLRLSDADVGALRAATAAALREQAEVAVAYHYGSSARGRPARDIDIALVVDHDERHAVDVEAIAASIARRSGRPVEELDVRIVNDADAVFLGNLMREGDRCYERSVDDRAAFEVRANNAWLDYQPVWQKMRKRVLEVWSRG